MLSLDGHRPAAERIETVQEQWQQDRRFNPSMQPARVAANLKDWRRAVAAAKAWGDDIVSPASFRQRA